MLHLFRALPTHWTTTVIFLIGGLALMLRWVFGTLPGVLGVAIAIYEWQRHFGESKPFGLSALAIWLSDLPIESRVSIISAVITVTGFLVAFRTATLSWRQQTLTNLRVSAAEEIQGFYDAVFRYILDFKNYADDIVECAIELEKGRVSKPMLARVQDVLFRLEEFRKRRARFSDMSVEVYRLLAKHYGLCATTAGLVNAMRECESVVSDVAKAMWVRAPANDPAMMTLNPEEYFWSLSPQDWRDFSALCDDRYDRLSAVTSVVRSSLLMEVYPLTVLPLLDMARNRASMGAAFSLLKGR